MASEPSHYDLLGIPPIASDEEIRRAYRAHAKQLHPDVSTADDATRRFLAIQRAYEVLSDSRQRALYDNQLAQAREVAASAIRLMVTLSHPHLRLSNDPQRVYALARISAAPGQHLARPALNLCVVLDSSLSMDGSRLNQALDAAQSLLDRLHPDDCLSVVAFSDRARVVIEGPLGAKRFVARERIRSIAPDGGTELLRGVALGLAQVRKWRAPGSLDRLILLTDGQTYGDEAGCVEAASAAGAERIAMTLLGLGVDWNERLLDEMAARSGGHSAFVDSAARLEGIFQTEFRELTAVLATDVTLACHCAAGVELRDVYRVTPDIARLHAGEELYPLGTLHLGHDVLVLCELVIGSAAAAGEQALLHLRASATPLHANGVVHLSEATAVAAFSADGAPQVPVPPEISGLLGRIAAFKVQERAMTEMERGELGRAAQRLKSLATHLLNIGEPDLSRIALLEADTLARTGHISDEGRKRIHYGTRDLSRQSVVAAGW